MGRWPCSCGAVAVAVVVMGAVAVVVVGSDSPGGSRGFDNKK